MFEAFKNMKDLAGLMGQAGELKEKMARMQEELGRRTAEGDAGAGAVRVTINGRFEVLRVSLDPVLMRVMTGIGGEDLEGGGTAEGSGENGSGEEGAGGAGGDGNDGDDGDLAMVEELIAAAMNDAVMKIQAVMRDEMSNLTGGLNLPGLGGAAGGDVPEITG